MTALPLLPSSSSPSSLLSPDDQKHGFIDRVPPDPFQAVEMPLGEVNEQRQKIATLSTSRASSLSLGEVTSRSVSPDLCGGISHTSLPHKPRIRPRPFAPLRSSSTSERSNSLRSGASPEGKVIAVARPGWRLVTSDDAGGPTPSHCLRLADYPHVNTDSILSNVTGPKEVYTIRRPEPRAAIRRNSAPASSADLSRDQFASGRDSSSLASPTCEGGLEGSERDSVKGSSRPLIRRSHTMRTILDSEEMGKLEERKAFQSIDTLPMSPPHPKGTMLSNELLCNSLSGLLSPIQLGGPELFRPIMWGSMTEEPSEVPLPLSTIGGPHIRADSSLINQTMDSPQSDLSMLEGLEDSDASETS
ncbi:unnamed protein product [Somion occarium]|uniref:Uncharacterized protein n=1 Tax=Somion occarium TaxID=3059160 RepID=A0ABP1CTA9_9APHY